MLESCFTILLVGCGAMGSALLKGWQNQLKAKIAIIDPNYYEPGGYASINDMPLDFAPDVIVFAIKPQQMNDILPEYQRLIRPKTICVSIAAGKSIGRLKSMLGLNAMVVRAMPNLPVTVGQGMTGLFTPDELTVMEKERVAQLFECVGQVLWVADESEIDLVTAISGSGPAYFYRLVEALSKASKNLGLTSATADQLAQQTFIGAASLLNASNETAAVLRQRVTSPGGTTAAALNVLENDQIFDKLIKEMIAAAFKRAGELAQ